MENKFSAEIPVKVENYRNGFVLNYDVREATNEEILSEWKSQGLGEGDQPTGDFIRDHKYVYYSVEVPMGQWNYGGVINAIVRDKYRVDEMEAITNNMAAVNAVFMQTLVNGGIVDAIRYLKESADSDDTEAFKQMQEWRAMAKREAKSVFKLE